jgi:membrane protein implicated in regulation of membrane protease activity
MPYLLLGIGFLIGLYGLYKFFLNANTRQIIALFTVGGFMAVFAALFYLAVTGRLPAALGLLVAITPFIAGYVNQKNKEKQSGKASSEDNTKMNIEEALEVLGLEEGASPEEIKNAYKKLMKKVHPDQEGSEWMAAKLNQAKDLLLK